MLIRNWIPLTLSWQLDRSCCHLVTWTSFTFFFSAFSFIFTFFAFPRENITQTAVFVGNLSLKHHFSNYNCILFIFQDICRSLRFTNAKSGVALSNHVIVDFKVEDEEHCQLKCYMEKNCFSYNYGPSLARVHGFTCELNDVDASSHPDDLQPRDGFVYQTAQVNIIISSNQFWE